MYDITITGQQYWKYTWLSSDRILQHFNIKTQANEFSQILIHVLHIDSDSSRIYSVFLPHDFGVFAMKIKKNARNNFDISVYPYLTTQQFSTNTFSWNLVRVSFSENCRNIVWLKLGKNNGQFTWRPIQFCLYIQHKSPNIYGENIFRIKVVEKNEVHSVRHPFSLNLIF
jgi:hypothetical protein